MNLHDKWMAKQPVDKNGVAWLVWILVAQWGEHGHTQTELANLLKKRPAFFHHIINGELKAPSKESLKDWQEIIADKFPEIWGMNLPQYENRTFGVEFKRRFDLLPTNTHDAQQEGWAKGVRRPDWRLAVIKAVARLNALEDASVQCAIEQARIGTVRWGGFLNNRQGSGKAACRDVLDKLIFHLGPQHPESKALKDLLNDPRAG